ncbi:MAG: hydrogenase maturation protease [Clostridia bacterium]|jgi:hydrogenase maturation protease|nr:hydrogenase maturation protease [Clostridia bacterium]MDH7572131.1 hydrogenase maturation protease [Clostridia bacterium]
MDRPGATDKAKVTVIGVGNLLMADDGVGIHALRELSREDWPPEVRLVDAGTAGPGILPYLEDTEAAVIMDCVRAGEAPGTIYRFPLEAVEETILPPGAVSLHDLDLAHAWHLLKLLGRGPSRAVVYGVEPARIDWGTELSPEVAGVLPRLVEAVSSEIRSWLDRAT